MTRVEHAPLNSSLQLDVIHLGDCLEIMKTLPDDSIDCIMTDPVWPDTKVQLVGSEDPWTLWKNACEQFERLSKNLIVHLGSQTDIRFLKYVPESFKFLRVAFLRYIPSSYKGNILYSHDVAYIFGDGRLPEDGTKVLSGDMWSEWHKLSEAVAVSAGKKIDRHGHPCPRSIKHASWLIRWYTRPGEVILDPFCGSGTTCEAARRAGRHYIGIEIVPEFHAAAVKRLAEKNMFEDDFRKL